MHIQEHTKYWDKHQKAQVCTCTHTGAHKAAARAHKVAGGSFGEGGAARLNGQHPRLPFAFIFGHQPVPYPAVQTVIMVYRTKPFQRNSLVTQTPF